MLRGRDHAGRRLENERRVRRPTSLREPPAAPGGEATVGFLANVKRIAKSDAAADIVQGKIHSLAAHEFGKLPEVRFAAGKDRAVDAPVQIGDRPERVRPPRVREEIDLLEPGAVCELHALVKLGDAPACQDQAGSDRQTGAASPQPTDGPGPPSMRLHFRMRQLFLDPKSQQRGVLIVASVFS